MAAKEPIVHPAASADIPGGEKYKNIPPKDIMNAIWGGAFDYKNFDKKVMDMTVRNRVYISWQMIHGVIKGWIDADEKGFLDYMRTHEPDNQ